MPDSPRTTLDLTGLDVHGPQIIYVDDTSTTATVMILTADKLGAKAVGGAGVASILTHAADLVLTDREHALVGALLTLASKRVANAQRIT